ncbi:hypothetical protein Q3G72_001260 [Acer saccharum]|nr:hypothetical protein Q3G72_001260 [Acer saccharum]
MEERVPQNHQEQQAHDPNPQEQHAFEHEGSVHGDEQLGLTMGEYTLPFVGNVPTAINKGKSPSTDEHINVLEVVKEEVKNVIGPEIVPKQVRVLDHSTKVEVDNLEKGPKNEEREKGEDFPIKLTNPGSFMIGVTI